MKVGLLEGLDGAGRCLVASVGVGALAAAGAEVAAAVGLPGTWPLTALPEAELLGRGGLLLSWGWLSPEQVALVPAETVCVQLRPLVEAPPAVRAAYTGAGVRSLSALLMRDGDGGTPVLRRYRELCGACAPALAARALGRAAGGPGRLLAGLAGVRPVEVAVLGAGVMGRAAASALARAGARVLVLDDDLRRLEGLPPDVATSAPGAGVLARSDIAVVTALEGLVGAAPEDATLPWPIDHGLPDDAVVVDLVGGDPTADLAAAASEAMSLTVVPFAVLLAGGAHPTAHRSFGAAAWWGDDPVDTTESST